MQGLIITNIQVFHFKILPQRSGATGSNPTGLQIKPQQLADGGWRGKSALKRRGEESHSEGGWAGLGAKTSPGKQGVNKLCWQSNIPGIHTRACIHNRWVYYGTPNEAAASDFKVTQPRSQPRSYYFIILMEICWTNLASGTTKWAKEISEQLTCYLWY